MTVLICHVNIRIVIRGGENTERSLLGLQMMYGIAQGMSKEVTPVIPYFYTNYHDSGYVDDLLLDIIITKCIQKMTELDVSGCLAKDFKDNLFSNTFFNVPDNKCSHSIFQDMDNLICREIVYYSNRTNALHYRTKENYTHDANLIVERKKNRITDYFHVSDALGEQITGQTPDNLRVLGNRLGFPLIDCKIKSLCYKNLNVYINDMLSEHTEKNMPLIACYDLIFSPAVDIEGVMRFFSEIREKSNVAVMVVSNKIPLSCSCADMIIDLTDKEIENYTLQYLSIKRCIFQLTAKGWHQYKRRDYGIEIFPSINTYFSKRRYLQRALVYTHSDVVTDTYQQYLDSLGVSDMCSDDYQGYIDNKSRRKDEYINDLLSTEVSYNTSIDILEKILLSQGKGNGMHDKDGMALMRRRDCIKLFRGGITAVIGDANTYKRFITFGSIFSSSLHYEHTLILLLNKDTGMIRRRLSCPAMSHSGTCRHEKCKQCYSYIHFMNIFMGNITADEFIYFLRRQICVPFADGRRISRVIIDDLQILDFCFPLLKTDSLFIPSLAATCRELDIDLYVLCDRDAGAMDKLRAIADNVLCTARDTDGSLLLYIERFAGYDNTPSKTYCGKIKHPKGIFECYDIYGEDGQVTRQYGINDEYIEDRPVPSMDGFWNNRDMYSFAKKSKK